MNCLTLALRESLVWSQQLKRITQAAPAGHYGTYSLHTTCKNSLTWRSVRQVLKFSRGGPDMYRDGSCWLPHVAAPFFDFYGRISVFSGLGLEMTDFECGKVRQSPRMVHGVVLWDTQGLPHVAALFSNFYGQNFDNFRLFLVLKVKMTENQIFVCSL